MCFVFFHFSTVLSVETDSTAEMQGEEGKCNEVYSISFLHFIVDWNLQINIIKMLIWTSTTWWQTNLMFIFIV